MHVMVVMMVVVVMMMVHHRLGGLGRAAWRLAAPVTVVARGRIR